jgi:O-antigen/teichoic acid export membrane protein
VIVSATVINLLLALLIAPRFGAQGMAWVTVFVEAYILIGLLWALRRRGLSPIEPKLLPGLWRDVIALVAKRS